MNLVIDRGNTQCKLGIFDQCQITVTDSTNFLDESSIQDLVSQYGITRAILSSVVNEDNDLLLTNLRNHIPFVLELNHLSALPFSWNYKSKESIGKDRLAAVAGAVELYPQKDVLVFDAGTALTYEVVDAKSNFKGGNISPGMHMRFKALNQYTSRLPLLEPNEDVHFIGDCTETAIQAGVQNSMVLEIDGVIQHLKQQYLNLISVITGGDAEFFARKLKNPIFVSSNLVLIGLNRILEYNAQ
ncbi:type III pantothenate kinase [Carboxylicivirga sp. N1Y90]|uniref:type III pantothenate kinase n=1 Tax=Carboxylicivirga fragile TaxID=3417571 RepID=UPI003D330CF6|nr:type III pantothenate kinase [Marinilabiliaceae bacterium N1Y90]